MFNKHHTPETKILISIASSGRKNSPGHRLAISKSKKGKPRSIETCNKISMANKGKTRTLEVRAEISRRMRGENNPMFGKKRSIEFCNKQSESRRGKNHPGFGKTPSYETRLNESNSRRLTFEKFKEKYPLICLVEEIRELPKSEWKVGMSDKQFRCKRCNKWFTPTIRQVLNRNYYLERNKDNSYFYCSDECENSCNLFGIKANTLLNNIENDSIHTSAEYQTFRQEVLTRQLQSEDLCFNHCEICNSELDIHVHHEHPVKTHPHLALDPDNGIILCGSCHRTVGHINECSTGVLANKVCTSIINNN
jgi:hypothetical protein